MLRVDLTQQVRGLQQTSKIVRSDESDILRSAAMNDHGLARGSDAIVSRPIKGKLTGTFLPGFAVGKQS